MTGSSGYPGRSYWAKPRHRRRWRGISTSTSGPADRVGGWTGDASGSRVAAMAGDVLGHRHDAAYARRLGVRGDGVGGGVVVRVVRYTDATAFSTLAMPWLAAVEAENSLALGICAGLSSAD